MRANNTTHCQAVFAWQHQIQHDQIRLLRLDTVNSTATIALYCHNQAIAFQVILGQGSESLIVLNDQDSPVFLGALCIFVL